MIGVVGAGAFGTALAVAQTTGGHNVALWGRDAHAMSVAQADRVSARLPDVQLPDRLECHCDLQALAGVRVLLLVTPAQQTEQFLEQNSGRLPEVPTVLCAKGIDAARLMLQTEIAREFLPGRPLAALSGPGFAGEIARGLPTALTLACSDAGYGPDLQRLLAAPRMRLYLSEDIVGVQVGGALKNVVAIGCGMVEGAGLGASAQAALMTRGFAEMTRLAVAMGARAETMAGLAGLGDLALSCNSTQSRNFSAGHAIGAGEVRPGGTVEGVSTARAACRLADRHRIEMPIAGAVADVLDGSSTLDQAMEALLARPLKEE